MIIKKSSNKKVNTYVEHNNKKIQNNKVTYTTYKILRKDTYKFIDGAPLSNYLMEK